MKYACRKINVIQFKRNDLKNSGITGKYSTVECSQNVANGQYEKSRHYDYENSFDFDSQ